MWRYLLAAAELHERAGDVRMARVWVEHALFQADRRNEELGQMRGHEAFGRLLRAVGQAVLAEQHIGRGLELARRLGDRRTSAELLLARGELRSAAGRPDEARRCAREALRLAQLLEWQRGIDQAQLMLQA
jgi:serine/threonine-protein kinase